MRHPKILTSVLIVFVVTLWGCSSQKGNKVITIAFYNCENFFDTIHNAGKEDEDFTPEGKYLYTTRIYEEKLHNIATVLQSMDNGGPAIAGLAEIENSNGPKDLDICKK